MRVNSVLKKKQQPTEAYSAPLRGVCMNCAAGCGLKIFREAGTEKIFGDENHQINKGALCPKIVNIRRCTNGGERLSVPCVRETPASPWRECAWEEALQTIAARLTRLREKAGSAVIALPGFGTETFDYFASASWFSGLLKNSAGPEDFIPSALGNSGALAQMFGVPGACLAMNTPRDWSKSKTILILGGDPAAESPISFGALMDARDRGRTVLYLGSAGGMTALRASLALLVRPGTEALALAALAHGLVRDGLVHAETLSEHTTGLDFLKAGLFPFTPETVAPFCGVHTGQLEQCIALVGHSSPLHVQIGSPAFTLNNDSLLSLGAALPVLRGSIGLPGGGFNMKGVSPFRIPTEKPDNQSWLGSFERLLLSAQKPSAVLAQGDWASRLGGGIAVREALKGLGFIVHLGCFDNATRKRALVSLPLSHWSEYPGLVDRNDGRALQWAPQLFEPFGQSRSPLEIWTALAGLMFPEAVPPWDQRPEESPPRKLAGHMLASNPLTAGITLEALDNYAPGLPSGGVLWPAADTHALDFERSRFIQGNVRGQNILFTQNSLYPCHDRRFPTPDGRIHLEAVVVPPFPPVAKPQALHSASGSPLLDLVIREAVGKIPDHPSLPGQASTAPGHTAGIHPETAADLGISRGLRLNIRNPDTQSQITAYADICWGVPPDTLSLEADPGNFLFPVVGGSSCTVEVSTAVSLP